MKTQQSGAPRSAPHHHRRSITTGAAAAALAFAIGACTPSSPANSIAIPSVALPSIDASAAASAVAGAAVAALDQVDTAITANQTSNALTADEATALQDLSRGVRTALQSGDTTGARTALENLSTKVDSFASKLTGEPGTQLKNAIAAVRSALPAS